MKLLLLCFWICSGICCCILNANVSCTSATVNQCGWLKTTLKTVSMFAFLLNICGILVHLIQIMIWVYCESDTNTCTVWTLWSLHTHTLNKLETKLFKTTTVLSWLNFNICKNIFLNTVYKKKTNPVPAYRDGDQVCSLAKKERMDCPADPVFSTQTQLLFGFNQRL